MADILILSRLINGIQRNVDISANTLVTTSIKIGAVSPTELTKTILDRLVSLQDGSDIAASYHHHDGRYFTESELGSATSSSGSDLIGDDDTYTNFTPSAATVKGALAGIDAALVSAGGSSFSDADFEIYQDGDITALAVFDLSAVSTASTRTILMPDSNVDLGDIAENSADIADLITLTGVVANSVNLGSFTGTVIADNQTIKQALQALETYSENSRSLIQNFEWQESALSYITDNTAAPPSEVSGDRYILSADGGTPHADYDGADAGDIVEFNGSVWIATTPTLGTFISADDESNVLYYWGGASWSTKAFESTTASTGLTKVGFDIQLANASAANGIAVSSGAISISLASDPGLEFSSGSLRVLVDPTGALERVSAGLDVKNLGIDTARLAATSVTAAKLGSDVAGNGLTGGNGSAISALSDSTGGANLARAVNVSSNGLAVKIDANTITENGSNQLSVQKSPILEESMIAGETFAANSSFLVRMALNGETAGRIYKADNDAGSVGSETNTIYVIGLAQNKTASPINAGASIPVIKLGNAILQSSDTPFTASQDEGLPVYLGASGAFTLTAPTATDEAVVKCGVVKNVDSSSAIEIGGFQIIGVNA